MNHQSQRSFAFDYDVGKLNESLSYPVLKEFIAPISKHPLIHEEDRYAPWDFTNPEILIEHKSVNYDLSNMDCAMINSHKVWRSVIEKVAGKRCFFCFRAQDGIYIIEYNTKQFRTYREEFMQMPDRPDFVEQKEDKLYIPVKDMTCLTKFKHQFVDDN